MTTETMVSHEAVEPSPQSTAVRKTHSYDSNKDQLLADLRVVVADAEQVIKEAADCSIEGFATLRTRFESKLLEAREKIDRTRVAMVERTRHATDATHAYVKENPWKFAGAFALAGAIGGFLLGRRPAGSHVDVPGE
jgi:ElaB/YqjD/DUF883 family membrane-anchored ribosome-binding protein